MGVPYNVFNDQYRAREADVANLLDATTIIVAPTDDGFLEIATTGAKTLQTAAQVALGTRVTIVATVSGVSVNGTNVADGETITFVRSLNSSAAAEWQVIA